MNVFDVFFTTHYCSQMVMGRLVDEFAFPAFRPIGVFRATDDREWTARRIK